MLLADKLKIVGGLPKIFDQFIYTGTGAAKTITTDLDLVNNRGLAVVKNRDGTDGRWQCSDTVNGVNVQLNPDNSDEYFTATDKITAFGTTGFTLGTSNYINTNGVHYVGFSIRASSLSSNRIFRVKTYTGNGTAGKTVNHLMGTTPTMIWIKNDHDDRDWAVYHKHLHATAPEEYKLKLNLTDERVETNNWNDTALNDTYVTLGYGQSVNENNQDFTMYTFADYPGIFKTGAYTGNGTSQNIDMGFATGASMFVSKSISATGGWHLWCKSLGIGSGNEGYMDLDNNTDETTGSDFVDYYASGITVKGNSHGNYNGADYIYFAFA